MLHADMLKMLNTKCSTPIITSELVMHGDRSCHDRPTVCMLLSKTDDNQRL